LQTEIPADINWVIRIDGHTDKRRSTPPSSLQLGAERGARHHGDEDLWPMASPSSIWSAGFGDSRPIDPGDTDEAMPRTGASIQADDVDGTRILKSST